MQGCASINFNNKACRPARTTHIYTVNRNCVDLCLQGNGDFPICNSQTDQNTTQILVVLDDILMFYKAFGVDLFVAGGACLL